MSILDALLPFTGVLGPIVQQITGALVQHIAPTEVRAPSVDDYVKMKQADNETAKVRADLENGGGATYPWVWAILKMQRPVILAVVVTLWAYQETLAGGSTDIVKQAAGFAMSWLFCERFIIGDGLKKK